MYIITRNSSQLSSMNFHILETMIIAYYYDLQILHPLHNIWKQPFKNSYWTHATVYQQYKQQGNDYSIGKSHIINPNYLSFLKIKERLTNLWAKSYETIHTNLPISATHFDVKNLHSSQKVVCSFFYVTWIVILHYTSWKII